MQGNCAEVLHFSAFHLAIVLNRSSKVTEMEEDELILKEEWQIYPPKFQVVISCSPAAQQSQARIEFKLAHRDLVFDIPLAPQPTESGINKGHVNNDWNEANAHDLWIKFNIGMF